MKMCDRLDDKYLISWPSMALFLEWEIILWISSATVNMFRGVVMVRILRKTAFGVLFCLSRNCTLYLSGMKLTCRKSGRKLVCENYGYKCHQQPKAIQPHQALSLRWSPCETELRLPPPCQPSLPQSWPLFSPCCLHSPPRSGEREESAWPSSLLCHNRNTKSV